MCLRRRPPFRVLAFAETSGLFAETSAGFLLFAVAGGIVSTVVVLAAMFDGEFPRPNAPFIVFKRPIVFYIFVRNKRAYRHHGRHYLRTLRREVFFVRLLLDPPELDTGRFDILVSNLSNRLMIFASKSPSLARIVE